jgi:hypothetical protein
MTISLTIQKARKLRLRAQHLHANARIGVADLVRDLAAVQAQDAGAEVLAVRVRTQGLTEDEVEKARVEERSVVRTWTLHLVSSKDIHWMLGLLGPLMIRKMQRRHLELGLTEDVFVKAVRVMQEALGDYGPLTRQQLAQPWSKHGLPAEGQAVPHLLSWASMAGIICFGPTVKGKATHVLLDDWLPDVETKVTDPRAELARRHVTAYGPATPDDFQAWSGLPVADARAGYDEIAGELLQVDVEGLPMWLLKDRAEWLDQTLDAGSITKMLGAFDTYLLGYRTRDLDISPDLMKKVHPGGGIIRPVILVDGRAVATWTRKRTGLKMSITVSPFEPLHKEIHAAVDAEVNDIGRFLGVDGSWAVE